MTRGGRIARRTLWGLGALLLVALLTVVVLLSTNLGLRLLLRFALPRYNDAIAGSVAVEAGEGRLLGSFTLRGVTLSDAQGRALVTAEAIAVEWSPLRLIGGELAIDALTLEQPRVFLPGDGGGFADLAPPGEDEPKDPSLPPGPDLPLAISLALHVRDAAVYAADAGPIAEALDLDARGFGRGRAAEVELLSGRGRLLGERELESLAARARWVAPVAAIDGLQIVADLAVLEIPAARLDVRAWSGLVDLRARAALAGLADYLPEGTAEKLGAPAVELTLAAEGDPKDMSAAAELAAGPGLALRLTAGGAWSGAPRAEVALRGEVDLSPWTGGEVGVIRPVVELHASELASGRVGLVGGLRCPECERLGGASVTLEGVVDRRAEGLSLETAVEAAGVGALVEVAVIDGALARLDWRLAAVDLAGTAAALRRFAAVPALAGTLSGRGACTGPALRCRGALRLLRVEAPGVTLGRGRIDVDVREDMSEATLAVAAEGLGAGGQVVERGDVRLEVERLPDGPVAPPVPGGLPPLRAALQVGARGEGDDRAFVDLSLRTGQEIGAELRGLAVDYGRVGAALERPARVVLSGTKLTIDDLALTAVGGRLAASGVVDADGPSDLRLDLDGVSLTRLRPLLPRLRPAGLASAKLRVRGRPEDPSLQAELNVAGAGLKGGRFGDITVSASLAGGRAEVDAAVDGPLARRLGLRVEAPVRVDMSQKTWSLEKGYTKLELRADELRLARLRPWLPGVELDGRVGGIALYEAHGGDQPLATPRIVSEWRARGLAVAGVPVGDVGVAFSHRGAWLQGEVDVHRHGGRARLDVQVPLELDLPRGRYVWHRERDHRALLQLDGVDLAEQLAEVAPGHDVAGGAELRVELFGPATRPELQAELRAEGLQHRRLELGSLTLSATMRDGGTSLVASGGGQIGRYQIQALAPIAVAAPAPGRAQDIPGLGWRRDGWYALDVDLHELELGPLAPLLGVDVGGRLSAGVQLSGAGERPRLHASVRAEELTYQRQPVGQMRAELELRDGAAELSGYGRFGASTKVELDARMPVDIDLTRGAFAWTTRRPGKVKLAVKGLDERTLEPFSPLPQAAMVELNLNAEAEIDAERLRGRAELYGALGQKALGGLPVLVRLDIGDAKQTLRGSLGRRGKKNSLNFAAEMAAAIPAIRRGEAELMASPIRGELHAQTTDLRYLSGFLPVVLYDLTGWLRGDLEVRGRLGDPEVKGQARLQRGGVTVVPLQQRLRDIELELAADGPRLSLTRLTATSGRGRLEASGAARLADGELKAEAKLDLRDFPVVRPGLPQMIVDTKVRADVSSDASGLDVSIAVDGAEVWVSDLTTRAPDPVPGNDKVKLVSGPLPRLQRLTGSQPGAAGVTEEDDAAAEDEADRKDMSLSVKLTSPVHIKGPTMDMRWSGAVGMERGGESTQVRGQLRSDRGRFELLGTQFHIDQGRVFLPADTKTVDPYLDLTANAHLPQADVTVKLRGRLSRPELHLSSQPALTEGQIFALLMTGSADTQESDPKKTQASAAGLLVNFSNPTLARFADQTLGIDRVKVGFGADVTQPVLTVGKHLSKSIYAETTYHHNAPMRQNRIEAQVEYRFAPAWAVETFFGDAAVGGLDVFWRRSFGRTRAAKRRADTNAPKDSR